jgi:hypothetical protein
MDNEALARAAGAPRPYVKTVILVDKLVSEDWSGSRDHPNSGKLISDFIV